MTRKTAPVPTDYPGLNQQAWADWIEYRRAVKKPIKEPSYKLAMRTLAAFGADQQAVVDQSIAFSWQGLFALRTQPEKAKPKTIADARNAADTAAIAQLHGRRAALGIPSFREIGLGETVSQYRQAQNSAAEDRYKRPLRVVK